MINSRYYNEDKIKEKELEYPLMARSKVTDIVVLFHGSKSGVIIYNNNSNRETAKIGRYSQLFVPVTNSNIWTILNKGEQVILTQE
jgi:hypothetical protein